MIALTLALFHSDPKRCIATADRAVERSRDLADIRPGAYAAANRALFRLTFGLCREEADDWAAVARGAEFARLAGDRTSLALYYTQQTVMDLDRADYSGALRSAQEVMHLGEAMGDGFNYMSGKYYSAWALLHLGRWGELRRIQAEGLLAAEQNDSPMPRSLFHLAAAALYLEALDYRGALVLCRRATPRHTDAYAVPLFVLLKSRAHLALGRHHEAICCLENLAQMAERLRRHFLRNLLGPPSHQKEQKIGDELLPSAPRPSPLVWSGPNKGSGHRSQMTRRPVAMPCVRPPTAAIASTFGLTPGARASGDYSTRSLTRSMSRSGGWLVQFAESDDAL
ncbi:hypothetical protein sS8_1480 [Methylocaldum marinum]|uniref:Uncharacterized protein n=1 Tax=Methylocaldum marinum TaxID=1432792 RepID=A0A250KP37_9GAMM|nr:hypothetical protein [Methylocaldum marinum]BBA33440.1 hypothetical protein sS8_1480 [Methylocaldum marinum]